MKRFVAVICSLLSLTAFAGTPTFNNLSKSDVQEVGNEFAANFAHTTVAAPETDGLWGVEVGIVGGKAASPRLKKVVNAAGGDGSDFENMYHAGLMARAHFPLELFAELSVLPTREISDVEVSNKTFGFGWNAGSFFALPLDISVGMNFATATISFDQTAPTSTVDVEGKSTVFWAGLSKKILFFTPYLKAGVASTSATIDSTVDIFGYGSARTSETVKSTGAYGALGFNIQLLFIRLGLEGSTLNGVKSASAKLSVAF